MGGVLQGGDGVLLEHAQVDGGHGGVEGRLQQTSSFG